METRRSKRKSELVEALASFEPPDKPAEDEITEETDENLLKEAVPPRLEIQDTTSENRLVVRHVIMYNFKSYFGKKVIGPFHKNVSVIMGPNGSGKSNVIDALLFVFGHRSNRIRCKRVSSLIHNSSLHKCNSCRVEVMFVRIRDTEDGGFEELPDTMFLVAREAFRNETSRYYFNGEQGSLKEIETRLQYDGIDMQHNRFLVLQGEVEAIAMLPPKAESAHSDGILEYLDDIIGTSRYKNLIERLEVKVEQIQKKLTVQEQKKKNLLMEKKSLIPKIRKYLDFVIRKNEETSLQLRLSQYELAELKRKEEAMITDARNKVNNHVSCTTRIKMIDDELSCIEKEEAELENEMANNYAQIEALNEEKEEKLEKERALRLQFSAAQRALTDYETQALALNMLDERYTQDLFEAEKVIEFQGPTIMQLELDQAEALDTAARNLKKFNDRTEAQKEEERGYDVEYAAENDILQAHCRHIETLKARQEDIEFPARQTSQTKARAFELLNRTKKRVMALHDEYVKLNNSQLELDARMKVLTNDRLRIDSELEVLVHRIEEANAAVENGSIYSREVFEGTRAHKALMQAKLKRTLRGLVGRLGDLGTIEKKYDIALSTMCNQLDFYVVMDKDAAEECINFLKRNNLQRCTFLCLDQTPQHNDRLLEPKNFLAPRLFDQIQTQDIAIKRLFYNALGDMLVTKGLQNAKDLYSKTNGRFRICTENGETIDRSGAMSGGGTPKSGRMGDILKDVPSYEDEQKMLALENQLELDKAAYNKLREDRDRIEAEYYEGERETQVLKRAKEKVYMELTLMEDAKREQDSHYTKKAEELELINTKKNAVAESALANDLALAEKEKEISQQRLNAIASKQADVRDRIEKVFIALVQKYNDVAADAARNLRQAREDLAKAKARYNKILENRNANEMLIKEIPMRRRQAEWELQSCVRQYRTLLGLTTDIDVAPELPDQSVDVSEIEDKIARINEKCQTYHPRSDDIRKRRMQKVTDRIEFEKKLEPLQRSQEETRHLLAKTKDKRFLLEVKIQKMKLEKMPCSQWYFDNPVDTIFPWMCETEDHELDQLAAPKRILQQTGEEEQDDSALVPVKLSEEEAAQLTREDADALEAQLEITRSWLRENRESIEPTLTEFFKKLNERLWHSHDLQQQLLANYMKHRNRLFNLTQQRQKEFMDGFYYIRSCLFDLVHLITGGGCAMLKIVDGEGNSPYEKGIKLIARPVRKAWKEIENLSGGEKTIVSLCFIFSLHRYRPTPFYVMDEIDAALDYRNVSKLAQYISMARNTNTVAQYVIISLREQMMECADRLIGVYKVHDMSQNVILDTKQVKEDVSVANTLLGERLKDHGSRFPEEGTSIDDEPREKLRAIRAMKRKAEQMTTQMSMISIRNVRQPSVPASTSSYMPRDMYADYDSDEAQLEIDEDAEPHKLESYSEKVINDRRIQILDGIDKIFDADEDLEKSALESPEVLDDLDPNIGMDWYYDEDPAMSDRDDDEYYQDDIDIEPVQEEEVDENRETVKHPDPLPASMVQMLLRLQKEKDAKTTKASVTFNTSAPSPKKPRMGPVNSVLASTRTSRSRRWTNRNRNSGSQKVEELRAARSRSPDGEDIFGDIVREDTPEKEITKKDKIDKGLRATTTTRKSTTSRPKPSTSRKSTSSSSEDEQDPDDDLSKFERQLR